MKKFIFLLFLIPVIVYGWVPASYTKTVGFGPGFAPMQRGGISTFVRKPGGMDLPSTVVALYLAEDSVDGGAGQYLTCANTIASTTWPSSIYSSVEAQKLALGQDMYGKYWLEEGSVKNIIASKTENYTIASQSNLAFIQVVSTAANADNSLGIGFTSYAYSFRLGMEDPGAFEWGWAGAGGNFNLAAPPYMDISSGVPRVITHIVEPALQRVRTKQNGTAKFSGTSVHIGKWVNAAHTLRIGSVTVPASYLRIYAVAVLAAASDEDIAKAETELMTKYGVTP